MAFRLCFNLRTMQLPRSGSGRATGGDAEVQGFAGLALSGARVASVRPWWSTDFHPK